MRVTLYSRDTTRKMLRVMLSPKSLKLVLKFMRDGTIKILRKDLIQISDTTE
jgi:hypothetical protein